MDISSISGGASSGAVFNTPGIRQPTDSAQGQTGAVNRAPRQEEAVQSPAIQQAATSPEAPARQQNAAPTESQRQEALGAGRSRGAFIDIQA